ncbi:MAG: DEAD/DEAH box helicase family protein, partial [Bacteroidales bacterium]|nr:DEAD/DEAH box helicase family protein [Bacteroidales bacterium]
MKLKFESDLDYQLEAVQSICDIFAGQEVMKSNFTVSMNEDNSYLPLNEIGIGNTLKLSDEELLENINKIQLHNGLPQTKPNDFKKQRLNFTIEMETGTGKTYVYLRSIFELHRTCGFTKFVIVVPSIAIKEGVYKSLQMTEEHFKGLFDNEVYNYFVYDSSRLGEVRSFATSDHIEIMIINIDAFRKSFENDDENNKSNIIHRYNDKLGYKPMQFIQSTHPIVIIDEPQSVDNTPKSKEAIAALNPLCCLRYSATHKEKYNLMYKLDSVDAYERKLVKQIEVATIEVENYNNQAYIHLLSVDNKSGIKAKIELDINKKGVVTRETKWVKQGDDLYDITKRELYEGCIVKDIIFNPDAQAWEMNFTSNSSIVYQGKATGDIDPDMYKREQIRMTIESHLDKELFLNPQGIKVLSLFFVDKVSNYRIYDEDGNQQKGKYAVMFEEEYIKLIRQTKYRSLFKEIQDVDIDVSIVHNGYFSIDKKSKVSDKKAKYECFIDTTGKTVKDDSTFNLIMKDKERLLSMDEPLRFIFSHSALREGWDNPNVFQICTLNETATEMKKRQEIGRGLRLCVNSEGDRVRGFEVNTLTVMANGSYEQFAKDLQDEIEEDMGYKFGVIYKHSFANIVVDGTKEQPVLLDEEKSQVIYAHFVEKGYIQEVIIDKKSNEVAGKVQDKLKLDLKDNRVDIPEEFLYIKGPIVQQLRHVAGNLNIKNRNEQRKVALRKDVLLSEDFKALWERIKYKTTYSVNFNSEDLIEKCASRIMNEVVVNRGKFVTKKVRLETTSGAVMADEQSLKRDVRIINEEVKVLPDIVTYIQNETNLTRKSIVDLLLRSKRLDAFKKNPQAFIEAVIEVIRAEMRMSLVDGIKYHKLGEEDIWCQELFM